MNKKILYIIGIIGCLILFCITFSSKSSTFPLIIGIASIGGIFYFSIQYDKINKQSNTTTTIDTEAFNNQLDNTFSEDYLNTTLEDGLSIKEHMINGYKNILTYQKESKNPKFHRTFEESELSFEFSQQYSKYIDSLENIIYEGIDYSYSNLEEIKQSIEKCNRSIEAYYELKRFCYTHKGGKIYFQDTWEYCDNATNPCFEYVEQLKSTKETLLKYRKEFLNDTTKIKKRIMCFNFARRHTLSKEV